MYTVGIPIAGPRLRLGSSPMPTLALDGTDHPLTGECLLGRHRSCQIQIKDGASSRQHCKVYASDGLWWVEDLGSANGTLLNGAKIAGRKKLRDKDKISIGQTVISFSDRGGESAEVVVGKRSAVPDKAVKGLDITALTGTKIADYRLDRYLGRGMLGSVYKGQQLNLDRPVAFKVFDPERCIRDAGLAKRFLAEAGKVGSVTHDGLVQLHESGEYQGLLWCSMEWVDGDTLEALLKRDGRVAPGLAFLIIEKVAEALHEAHTHNVIHGDLRPSHVIVMADGRIKLTDVGMMGIFEEAELPSDGPATLAWYLSPEEAAEGASDPRSDIYSLGCLLYHLLTGKPPFTGKDTAAVIAAHSKEPIPSVTAHGVPPGVDGAAVDTLLQGLMAKNPEWRHASMTEVIAEVQPLREVATGERAEVKPVIRRVTGESRVAERPPERASELSRDENKLRKALFAVLGVIAAALILALILPYLSHRAPPPSDTEPVTPPTAVDPSPAPVAQQPKPVTPVTQASTQPLTQSTAASNGLTDRWRQLLVTVDQAQAANEWSTAEQALATFATETANAKADPVVARALTTRQQQLAQDGDQWYQQALTALPRGDGAGELAKRLKAVDGLRDTVLADNRPDAESRYQEALTKLGQRLNAAKRQARQAVESGRITELPKIASDLAPAFAGTPVADLHRQFALLCNEGAGIKPLWSTSWAVTRSRLLTAKGADALAAAAALILAGDTGEAKALLANDAALASGDLLRRREALVGRKAAVLAFEDPEDLQYIEVITGAPRMAAGTLTGTAGEAIGLSCAAPLSASGWDVAIGLQLEQAMADGQAVVSLARADSVDAQVRIERDALYAKVRTEAGWQEVRIARPETKILRLRLTERGGAVSVLLNDQVVLKAAKAKVPVGSVLRFEAVGMVWAITDLQVVGGE